jgi:hypothetical protein
MRLYAGPPATVGTTLATGLDLWGDCLGCPTDGDLAKRHTRGNSLSILALAFLISYGTEDFFVFLDGLERAFTKQKTG